MRPIPRPTYARIAHKLGAVTREDLRRARGLAVHGGSLEERLLSLGALDPEVAPFVRAAWELVRALCERCGRRTDVVQERGSTRGAERGCACPRPAEPILGPLPERSAS